MTIVRNITIGVVIFALILFVQFQYEPHLIIQEYMKSEPGLEKEQDEQFFEKSNDTISENCTTCNKPEISVNSRNESWISIEGALLRSAFLDDRGSTTVVRILAYLAAMKQCNFMCVYVSKYNFRQLSTTKAKCVIINNHESVVPVFLECEPPRGNISDILVTVQSENETCETKTKTLQRHSLIIQHKIATIKRTDDLISCVSPMFNWNSIRKLFIFIEYYKRQGVNHFFIYRHSVSNETQKYLRMLESTGIATVINWSALPNMKLENCAELSNTANLVHYNGQILSMNECMLWSYQRNARFVLTVDIDEFIWPKPETATLRRLLNELDESSMGSADFRSAFLFQDSISNSTKLGNLSEIFSERDRSKQAAKPAAIYRQTVHLTWQYFGSSIAKNVDTNLALIYHLKDAEMVSQDDSLVRFATVLKNIKADYSNRSNW